MKKTSIALAVAVLLVLPVVAYAKTVYVNSMRAPLFEKPDMKAKKTMQVERGTALEVMQQQGRWLRVNSPTASGWIFDLMVKDSAPLEKVGIADKDIAAIQMKARRRPSDFTTAASARGLYRNVRGNEEMKLDFPAVEKLEAIEISEEELLTFLGEVR